MLVAPNRSPYAYYTASDDRMTDNGWTGRESSCGIIQVLSHHSPSGIQQITSATTAGIYAGIRTENQEGLRLER
jgi:hypothetical protein